MRNTRFISISALSDSTVELRTAECEGEEYLVIPVIALVGDIVVWPANAPGPEFVPKEVLADSPQQWNGRPICLNHPKIDGNYVSANNPEVLSNWKYGLIFNSRFDTSDNKLKMEAWLSRSKAKLIGSSAEDIITKVENGEMVEISVGAHVEVEEQKGMFNGEEYEGVWKSLTSDHLATLEEGLKGACSISDGCGLLRVSTKKESNPPSPGMKPPAPTPPPVIRAAILSQARIPTYSGTETSSWSPPSFSEYIKYLHPGSDGPKSVSQCDSELKRKIASHSLLGDPEANNLRELAFFPVVNPANGNLNEKALRAVLGSRGENADIDEKAKQSAQDVARRLLNSEFSISNLEVNVSDKHKRSLKKFVSSMLESFRSAMSNNDLRYKLFKALSEVEPGISYVNDEDVEAKTVIYCVVIKYGDSWSYDDYEYHFYQRTFDLSSDGKVTLNDDRVEVEFYEAWKPVNGEESIKAAESNNPTCSCHKGESTMASKEMVEKFAKMSDAQLEKLMAMAEGDGTSQEEKTGTGKETNPNPNPSSNPKPEGGDPGDENTVVLPAPDDKNPQKPQTEEQWLASAPESIRKRFEADKKRETEYRNNLVSKLKTASKFTEDKLKSMETETLETLAQSLGVDKEEIADFSGRSGIIANASAVRQTPDTWGLRAAQSKAN